MSRFDDFFEKKKGPEPNIFGCFDCWICHSPAASGHLSEDKTLIYTCPNGHTTVTENFNV